MLNIHLVMNKFYNYINPRRAAQECYGTCLVCVSVPTPAPTSLVSTLKVMYVSVHLRLFLLLNSWNFDKSFRSGVMA